MGDAILLYFILKLHSENLPFTSMTENRNSITIILLNFVITLKLNLMQLALINMSQNNSNEQETYPNTVIDKFKL